MVRRVLTCLLLAAAAMASSGRADAQEIGLRPALEDDPLADVPAIPLPVAPHLPTLEVNPIILTPSPVKRGKLEDDPYAPLGVDLGAFVAYGAVNVGGVYTDNVAQSHADRKSDIGLRLRPSLRVESDWVRHSLVVNAAGDFAFYRDDSANDAESASALARLRLDVRRATEATLEASYYLSQDSAGTSDVPGNAIGNRTNQTYSVAAGLTHRTGIIETTLKTGVTWETFGDVELAGGGVEDNSDRNFYQPEIVFRAAYAPTPAFKPYLQAAYRPRFHEVVPDRNGLSRDSQGYALSAGVAFDDSPIWSGDLALIYLLRDFDDPALHSLDSFGVTGNVVWRPTEITSVTLVADTFLDETTLTGSSGSRNYTADLDLAHELRAHLIVHGGAGVELDDFQGVDLDELTATARLGVIYRLSRFVALTGDYDYTWFDSTTKSSDYRENRVTVGIELRR
jgi:hypothetical protein